MNIGIIGDYNPAYPSQRTTCEALLHAARQAGLRIGIEWISSSSLHGRSASISSHV
ncbi:hypothetical protein WMW72_28480 [Paenibacillus filicis]|uniref:Luciferase-like monooxygenase n=1 Tax=Paenibacillus filicis TaxID=669464 RepID=A0ABU9DUC4_9BACL